MKKNQDRKKVYIGIDVHQNSYSFCLLDGETGEYMLERKVTSPTNESVLKYVKQVRKTLGSDVDLVVGYEAGYCGYTLPST